MARTIALIAIGVIAVICAVILLAGLTLAVLMDLESRLQARRRQLALRRDIRAFEKGRQL